MRILAVDDDPVFLQLLTTVLVGAGYKAVTKTESAADAIRILRSGEDKFDCLLLDIKMPGMCGIELCRKVRRLPEYKDTPIIMLTALKDGESIEKAFEAGANDYVTKPLQGIELGSRIRMATQLNDLRERNLRLLQSRTLTGYPLDEADAAVPPPGASGPEIEGAVNYLELENYFLRSGENIMAVRMFAIAIDTQDENLGALKCGELLAELATAVSSSISNPKTLISCCDDGVIVFVSKGRHRISVSAIQNTVNQVLDDWCGEVAPDKIGVGVRVEHEQNYAVCSGHDAAKRLRDLVAKTTGELENIAMQRRLKSLRDNAPSRLALQGFFREERVLPRRVMPSQPS